MLTIKHAIVTGANGFIGQHLVRFLLDNNIKVRGICHGSLPLYFVKPHEFEKIEADLNNRQSLVNICKNCDVVFHCAAIPRNDLSKTWEEFKQTNIDGTKYLLEEAVYASVKRFVFISSVEAAGFGNGISPRIETDTSIPDNNYGKSKLLAEELVLSSPLNIERVVVRLPMIYGPGTFMIVPKIFGMVKKGFYPLIGDGHAKMEFCYVKNAIQGIFLAGQHAEANKQLFYLNDQKTYSIKEVITNVAAAMNKKILFLYIPRFVAYTIALCVEILAKILPIAPIISPISRKSFFTRETVFWTTRDVNWVNSDKARSILGYNPPIDIKSGCESTVKWLKMMKKI